MTCAKCNAEYVEEPCPQCEAAATPQSGEQQPRARKAEGRASIDIDQSWVRDVVEMGDQNTVIGRMIANFGASERPLTLFDHLEKLGSPDPGAASLFHDSELQEALSALDRDRLLLVLCSDGDVAHKAKDALLTRIAVADRRILSFSAVPAEVTVDVHGLTRRTSRRNELFVVVDAYEGRRADAFVDSLFADGVFGKLSICSGLQRVRLRIACIANEENLAARMPRLEFGHWLVSSARMLLRKHFQESATALEEQIAAQRRAGNWSRSSVDFRQQLEELIHSGDLLKIIERGGPLAIAVVETKKERGPVADGDNALFVAVLYTATFYPNLSPSDFATIVDAIVGDQRTLVPETIQQKTKDGSFRPVELKRERRIAEIWAERTDAVLRECRLITSREDKRAITFSDAGRRDLLRRHLDEQYGVYVQRQFLMAWEKGLLFADSSRIASAVIALTVDMALAAPDQIGRDWLTDRIVSFCESGLDPALVLRRASDLLRTMLRHSPLDLVVNGVVQRLLQLGRHAYALFLVKSLRRTAEFDDLYWLQQIVDRGTEEVRGDVLVHLFSELRRSDSGIHRYVATLADKWLPAPDRLTNSYSHANGAALLTVFAYCFETTDRFDRSLYGAWPSRFPIIAADRTSAATQFGAILRCLFHPGLVSVLDDPWKPEQLARELAGLLSKWVFILYGVADRPADAEEETSDFTRDDALATLVGQFLAVTKGTAGRATRALIVDEWEWAKEMYLDAPSRVGDEGFVLRHELGRRRRLLQNLITEFRRQQRAEQKSASAHHASARREERS